MEFYLRKLKWKKFEFDTSQEGVLITDASPLLPKKKVSWRIKNFLYKRVSFIHRFIRRRIIL